MAWTRWAFNKTYNACASIAGYVDYAVSPVKPLMKAIYNCTPVARFREGVVKIQHIVPLISHDGQTASLLRRSSLVMMQYLAFAWSVSVLEKTIASAIPDEIPCLESTLIWTVRLGFFVPRYYFRRLIDNLGFTLCIPRAVNDDMNEILVEEMSEHLGKCLWPGFKNRFFRQSDVGDSIDENEYYREFIIKLHRVFEDFFLQHTNQVTEVSLQSLINPLRIVIYETLQQSGTTVPHDVIQSVSENFSKLAIKEIALCFSPEFIEIVTKLDDQFSKKLSTSLNNLPTDTHFLIEQASEHRTEFKKALQQTLAKNYLHKKSAAAYSEELMRIATDLREHVDAYLPIPFVKPCDCDFGGHVDGGMKSPIHYFGKVLFIAACSGFLNDNYNAFWFLLSCLRALNFGQSVYEYVIASQSHCSLHRSNKTDNMQSLGLGVSYLGISAVIAKAIETTFGVNNFLSHDAIDNFVMQLLIAAIIADRKPKVGVNDIGWDVFVIPRWLTDQAIKGIKWLAFSELEDAKGREKTIHKIKNVLSKPTLHHTVRLFLDENEIFPKKESWQPVLTDIKQAYQQFVAPYQKPTQKSLTQEKKEEKKIAILVPRVINTKPSLQLEAGNLFCEDNLKNYHSPVFAEDAEKNKKIHIQEINNYLYQKRERRFKPFLVQIKEQKTIAKIIPHAEMSKIIVEPTPVQQPTPALTQPDVLQGLCRYPAILLILRTFRNEIDKALAAIKMGQSLTKWVPDSVLTYPVPSAFSALAHIALLLLKNEAFANVLQQFDLQMILIRSLPKDLEARTEIVRNIMGNEFDSKEIPNTKVARILPKHVMREEKTKKRIDTVKISLLSKDAISNALNRNADELMKKMDPPKKKLAKPVEQKNIPAEAEQKPQVEGLRIIDNYTNEVSLRINLPPSNTIIIQEEPEEYEIVPSEVAGSISNNKRKLRPCRLGLFGKTTSAAKSKEKNNILTAVEMRAI